MWKFCTCILHQRIEIEENFILHYDKLHSDRGYFKIQKNHVKQLKNYTILSMRGMHPSIEYMKERSRTRSKMNLLRDEHELEYEKLYQGSSNIA